MGAPEVLVSCLDVVSPVDGSTYAKVDLADDARVEATLAAARAAQPSWARVPLAERVRLMSAFVEAFLAATEPIATELTWQMGRPIRFAPGEVQGVADRARAMIALSVDALAPLVLPDKEGFERFITREPLGVVLTIAAWNYPYLIAVNSVVPALLAGNTVVLKHSAQTPLCAERFAVAMAAAGVPSGVFQIVHCDHATTARMVADPRVDFVAFTGSVEGGRAVHRAAADRFVAVGLELGGKDPAYVREDAYFEHTVESVVDGAFFNSGQSCCGIERVYVHRSLYPRFVDAVVAEVEKYVLGNPLDSSTTLGPLVRARAADFVRGQTAAAVRAGARALIDPTRFPSAREGSPYLAPQVLVDVDHSMEVMKDETFGPVVGIMAVDSDEEAVALMNDSAFGLTASVWSADRDLALSIGRQLETGTVFLNRCDYLDPLLAWVGVKDSGRGCTLSRVGFEHLTRPKSFHLRLTI